MSVLAKRFNRNLRRKLSEHGAKADMARKLKMSRSLLQGYVTDRTPRLETVEMFAKALKCDPAELLRK